LTDAITSIVISKDEKYIIAGSVSGVVNLYGIVNLRYIRSFGHEVGGSITSLMINDCQLSSSTLDWEDEEDEVIFSSEGEEY